jgi:hypothetical protein
MAGAVDCPSHSQQRDHTQFPVFEKAKLTEQFLRKNENIFKRADVL